MLGSICCSFALNEEMKLPAFAGNGRGPGSVADTVGGELTLTRAEAADVAFDAFVLLGM